MKKIKITKRERKAAGRNFAWMQTRRSSKAFTYGVAGSEYLGASGRSVSHSIPFIRIG